MDSETEEIILKNISNMQRNFTIIMTTNRISTAKNCDKIMILKKGKITNIGSHEQLLKKVFITKKYLSPNPQKKKLFRYLVG